MSDETPRDEFDVVPLEDGRRGAHRARRSRVASLLSAALVAGATAAVAGGAYVLLHGTATPSGQVSSTRAAGSAVPAAVDPASDASAAGTPSPADAASDAASDAVSDTGSQDPAPVSTGASTGASTATSTAQPGAAARAAARVDTTLPLVVLNGTRTAGLAAKASSQLHRLGWRVQSTGNDRSGATATTVTYRDARMAGTAAAVAEGLGGEAVQDRSATEGVLTVVLGPDYAR